MRVVLCANTDWFLYQYNRELCAELADRGDEVTLISPPGRYSQELEALGYEHLPWDVSRAGTAPWIELSCVRSLGDLFEEVQPRLIHNFTLKSALYGSIAARRCSNTSVVSSITGLGWTFSSDSLRARFLRPIVLRLARFALDGTHTVFLNRSDRELLVERSAVARETSDLILSSGVDVNRFASQAAPAEPPIATFVGRMLWDKGAKIFVDAARLLRDEGIEARFRLVGSPDPGNPASIPEESLREWHDEGAVEWVSFRDEMQSVYEESSIVCLPSAYGEGVPTVLLEGGAASRALVAVDNQGSREIVRDGETGLLVQPDDPADLARALRLLFADSDLRRLFGRKARELVETSFRVEEVVERTLEVYHRAMGGHPQTRRPRRPVRSGEEGETQDVAPVLTGGDGGIS